MIQSLQMCLFSQKIGGENSWYMKMFFPGGSTEKMKNIFGNRHTVFTWFKGECVCGGGGELQSELLI